MLLLLPKPESRSSCHPITVTTMPSCNCCFAFFSSENGLNTHVSAIAACREHAMLAAGRLLHQRPQHLNGNYNNCLSSLSSCITGGSGSVLPVAGIPNLFSQLLPPERCEDPHNGSEEDGAAFCLKTMVLTKVTVFRPTSCKERSRK